MMRPLHRGAVERRAARAELALSAERSRRKVEARRSLLSAMVTDLASGFVNAPSDAVDRAIAQALQELCHAVDGDRVLLSAWDASSACLRWGRSWSRTGIPPASGRGSETPLDKLHGWLESAKEGRILEVPSRSSLEPGDPLAAYMERYQIGSMIALPLMEEERCTGFLVIETHQRATTWGHDEFSALVVAAELFANSAMRRQHEAALEKALGEAHSALRARDAFLASLSHELRTPMNGVLGMAQLLSDGQLAPAQREQVRAIQRSAGQLQRILGDLLDFTRLESGDLRVQASPVDVRELLGKAAAPLDGQPGGVSLGVDPSVPRLVMADGERLHRIISVLLENSRVHAPGSRIAVIATHDTERLRITVSDGGAGMDGRTLAHLFEPFVQGDTSDSRRSYGLGLGLAIAKRSCRLMGGDLHAASEPGKGSSFTIDLPAEAVASPPPDAERAKPGAGVHVLVADGSGVNRLLLQGMLQELGCTVECADDGIEAVQKALAGAYALILLSPAMHRMDGISAARAIRGGESRLARQHTRIVALPGPSGAESADRIRAAGIDIRLERQPTPAVLADLLKDGTAASTPGRRRGGSILVVDDNAVNLKLLSLMVSQAGYPTETCEDGRAAAERVSAGGIGLVLMDCQMPIMDGYEATRRIRDDEQARGLARTPIVAVTAHAMPENRQRCKACGMDGFLTKPIDAKLLLATIANCLAGVNTPPPAAAPPPASPAAAAPPMDLATLRQLEEASPGAGRDIARTMVADIAAARELLPGLLRQRDLARLAKEAHKLKGAAGSIGGTDFSRACAALEQAARKSDAEGCAIAVEAVLARSHPFATCLSDYAGGRC